MAVDPELVACLSAIPNFVTRLERNVSTTDLNMAHVLTLRTEEFLELLRVLSGRFEELQHSRSASNEVMQEAASVMEDVIALSRMLLHFGELYSNLSLELEDLYNGPGIVYLPCPVARRATRGRPCVIISEAQISALTEMGFSFSSMARMFGVSVRTLLRRRNELGLQLGRNYSSISDNDLDDVVRFLVQGSMNAGLAMIRGGLRARGIVVQRRRVSESLHRVDPLSQIIRRRVTTYRRQYNVPSPNSLWHIDGLHKLIRWKLVIHGGIDGYSRLVTFLGCSNNNMAETVLNLFMQAGVTYGYPSRVRSDHGLENIEVARWMIANMGVDRGSHITGSSVHNQRIERLWREVNRLVSRPYRNLFHYLEEEQLLDPLDEVDLYCLHRVYLPRINESLLEFQRQYNNHPVRTEGNQTPHQIFVTGMLMNRDCRGVRNLLGDDSQFDPATYGIEEEGPVPLPDDSDSIVVQPPMLATPLTLEDEEALDREVREVTAAEFGIPQYIQTREFIRSVL